MFDYDALLEQMNQLADEKYQQFIQKLLPGIDGILGIRLPQLKKLAKQIRCNEVDEYLSYVRHESFEETMLMGFVIGGMSTKDFSLEEIIGKIEALLPHISNWSTCDSFCASLKIAKKEQESMFLFLSKKFESCLEKMSDSNSSHQNITFQLRFVIVMWLDYYLNETYLPIVFEKLKTVCSSDYYVNMAIAWCYSAMFVSDEKIVKDMLQDNVNQRFQLNKYEIFVHNKTIQKICESLKVNLKQKEMIKKLRISMNV